MCDDVDDGGDAVEDMRPTGGVVETYENINYKIALS